MKINMPVTNHEVMMQQETILVTRTDLKGVISYANQAFIDISGFSRDELIGKNHNVVRHPDMPAAAFEDLWMCNKAGKPWMALVKNRCKNGDFYWVEANVTPVFKDGMVVEYLSVRYAPSRQQINAAEQLYQKLNEKKAKIRPQGLSLLMKNLSEMKLAYKGICALTGFLLPALFLMNALFQAENYLYLSMVVLLNLLSVYIGSHLIRLFGNTLEFTIGASYSLAGGYYKNVINIDRNDQIGDFYKAFYSMQVKLNSDLAEIKEAAAINERIKQALDQVTGNVMMANADLDIIYMNNAAVDLFNTNEADFRKDLPNLKANELIGTNIDVFHKDPSFQRKLLGELTATARANLLIGGHDMVVIATPVFEGDNRLGTVVEWIDQTEEKARLEAEAVTNASNERIKQALDQVTGNVMMANADLDIIYMNNAAVDLFNTNEADFRKDLPNLKANELIGTNIDVFHKDPSFQRKLLGELTATARANLLIGGHDMVVIATPVFEGDNRLGTVVEWIDKTQEVAVQLEIDNIVSNVKAGILENRIEIEGKEGFFAQLSTGINELTDEVEQVISEVAHVMGGVAEGDLTRTIDKDYQGTFGSCKNDINSSLQKLSDVFGQVLSSAEFINNSSQEIASGNNNLSQRAEQQASSLEQTASSMEELTSTVKNNAENAQQADQVASTARQLAESGGEIVASAVSAMEEINDSSNKIAEIIGVIDEIAFQTNLLALNASVEAARAGEQGRGFSVVATEVRNLAQRSATAARESKELIQTSVQKVRSGTDFVNQAGKSLADIVIGVKKVGDIVAEIAAASAEQSQGIEQVNQAISSMDEITQQNAALAEQASAASVSMSEQSTNMTQLLSFFTIDEQQSTTIKSTSPASSHSKKQTGITAPSISREAQAVNQSAEQDNSVANDGIDSEWEEF